MTVCIGLEDSNELCDYLLENLKGPTEDSPKLETNFEAVKLCLPGQPAIHRWDCDGVNDSTVVQVASGMIAHQCCYL